MVPAGTVTKKIEKIVLPISSNFGNPGVCIHSQSSGDFECVCVCVGGTAIPTEKLFLFNVESSSKGARVASNDPESLLTMIFEEENGPDGISRDEKSDLDRQL